jgi:hypothetical protein
VSKHRARRNWMPLVAGSVVLAVTGGIIVGFTIATGGSPSLASHPRTRQRISLRANRVTQS